MFNCFKKKESYPFNNKIKPENYNFNIQNFNPLLLKKGNISETLTICINDKKYICKKYQKLYTKEYRNEIHILKNIYSITYFPCFFKNLVDVKFRYILYQYIEGIPLSEFNDIVNFKIDDDLYIKQIIYQITDALHCLLQFNFVYLNLKPDNIIMLNHKPASIKLIDLKYCENIVNKNNKPFRNYGYCAPEIVFQKKYYHNTDVWSLGCIIYYILTKSHLFYQRKQDYFYQLLDFSEFNKVYIESHHISFFAFNIIYTCLSPIHILRPSLLDIKKLLNKTKQQIT